VKYLSDAPILGKLLALHANIRLGWKWFPGTNSLAYFENSDITTVKFFITLAPSANVKRLGLITEAHNK